MRLDLVNFNSFEQKLKSSRATISEVKISKSKHCVLYANVRTDANGILVKDFLMPNFIVLDF